MAAKNGFFIILYFKRDILQWSCQVINRSYDGDIKDSPTSLVESHDILPPYAVIASVEMCRERVVERVNPHHEVENYFTGISLWSDA